MESPYYAKPDTFEGDMHRRFIGGMWEEIGGLQFDFMVAQGLKPHHRLIDVACGSLRGGVRFIDYLDPFHYFGVDINAALIRAGIDRELTPQAQAKIDARSFRVSDDFDFGFEGPPFDFGVSISLFTHLSQNNIRLCLHNLRPKFEGGKFFATFFTTEQDDVTQAEEQLDGVTTYHHKNPFHYHVSHIAQMAEECGWQFEWIGDFDHPRNQKMALFF